MALYLGDKLIATASDMKDRFHFKGELELEATRTDWEDLIPCKTAQVYLLTNDTAPTTTVTIDGETYSVGDWVFIKNDVKTGETGVEAIKLTSSSEAIKIVEELPTTDINNKMFYVIPHLKGYSYTALSWYTIAAGSTSTIQSDGIHDDTGALIIDINDVTSAADLYPQCTINTADSAQTLGAYIMTYTIVYDDGTTSTTWCTHAKAPHTPTSTAWSEAVQAKEFSVYLYNEDKTEWNCLYPIEADAIKWVQSTASIAAPKDTTIYGVRPQQDVTYYKMSDAEKALGSTISAAGVTIVSAGKTLTMAEIAANPTALSMTYGFSEVTEAAANADCVVTYTIDGTGHAEAYAGFVLKDKSELYVYNGADFEMIYPTEQVDDIVYQVELTETQYEAIVDGTSTETYDKNALYFITDYKDTDAPVAYLNGKNVMTADAIIDVTTLASSTTQLAKINKHALYRVMSDELKYTDVEYWKLGTDYYITDNGSGVDYIVRSVVGETDVWIEPAANLRVDDATWQTAITTYGITQVTAATADAQTMVMFHDVTSATPDAWIVDKFNLPRYDLTDTYSKDNIYFYSDELSKWVCIYPTAAEFQDVDIAFNDSSVWYPIKP